jgi:protein SCO1/2
MKRTTAILVLGLLSLSILHAQSKEQRTVSKVFNDVGIDQRLNQSIPLDLSFRDEDGNPVTLGSYFHDKPVVLSLVYYECPMLCTQVLNGMVECFLDTKFTVGKEFNVVTVSFNPRETPELAKAKKDQYIRAYGHGDAGKSWHFLTGDEESIRKLTDAVGFHYVYDEETHQYAHASGIMVLTREGKLARYFYGIEYAPRDMEFAVMDASHEKIGSPVERLLLLCYHYDPSTGKYSLFVLNLIKMGGAVTLIALAGGLIILFRHDRKQKNAEARA